MSKYITIRFEVDDDVTTEQKKLFIDAITNIVHGTGDGEELADIPDIIDVQDNDNPIE